MKSILGKKQYMSQVFKEDGKVYPVTVVQADPSIVVAVKTIEKDGYEAVQLGFGIRKEKNIKKPALGQMKGLGNFEVLREFRVNSPSLKEGDTLGVGTFAEGDEVVQPHRAVPLAQAAGQALVDEILQRRRRVLNFVAKGGHGSGQQCQHVGGVAAAVQRVQEPAVAQADGGLRFGGRRGRAVLRCGAGGAGGGALNARPVL